ncbi:MAG: IS66 family transposase [Gemmataceae bacterium]|nr:IS66 family transposase [Gemmataceae bacterium]
MNEPECANCVRLMKVVAALEKRVQDLEDRLGRNARNSSLPPSANPPGAPKPVVKKPTGRKPGGQPGHPFHSQYRFPPEQVKTTIQHIPDCCEKCACVFSKSHEGKDLEPRCHQMVELPPIVVEVTEYQAHGRRCPDCQHLTWGTIPSEVRRHRIGSRLGAVVSYLSEVPHVSKRGIEELLEGVFGVPISLGAVSKLEKEMSEALNTPHAEVLEAVRQAKSKNVDETGWKIHKAKAWMWSMASNTHAAFTIHFKRDQKALKSLIGDRIEGVYGSDRWWAYTILPVSQRQLCWAHLKRDFQKIVDRAGDGAWVGWKGLRYVALIFEWWHYYKAGKCSRKKLKTGVYSIQRRMRRLLEAGIECGEQKTARFCTNVLKFEAALWTFLDKKAVEPTNNHIERIIRSAVLWRKIGFGCHSLNGCRFVERILTVIKTLRLQSRNVLDYLHQALLAHRQALPTPSIA